VIFSSAWPPGKHAFVLKKRMGKFQREIDFAAAGIAKTNLETSICI